VRSKPFGGKLTESQVEGMGYILDAYEMGYADWGSALARLYLRDDVP
jgi:hypothetical protein